MCESNVYLVNQAGDSESLFLESVDQIIPEGPDSWRLTSIFGEQKMISGRLISMNLVDHRILFQPLGED